MMVLSFERRDIVIGIIPIGYNYKILIYILEYIVYMLCNMESFNSCIYFILRLSGMVWCVSKIRTIKTIFEWPGGSPHTSHLSAQERILRLYWLIMVFVSQGDRDVVVIESQHTANNNYLSSIQSKQDAKNTVKR